MRLFRFGLLILSVSAFNAYGASFLGTAAAFSVLGGSTVTNTGPTTLGAQIGVWPGTSITDPVEITHPGPLHLGDAVAQQAQGDATIAYNALTGLSVTNNLSGTDLGFFNALNPLTVGVYKFNTSAQLTGNLTLDFAGQSDKNIVFLIGSTLTTASASSVTIIGGNSTDNVYWQVGSSATLGTTTSFLGNIIALTSVTLTTGATDLCGSVIARNGAVTMDTNTITNTCTAGSGGTIGGGTGGGPGVPLPEGGSTLQYLSFFVLAPIGAMLAFRGRRSI